MFFVNLGIILNLFCGSYIISTAFKEIDKLWADYTLFDKDAKKLMMVAFGISITSFMVFSTYDFTYNSHVFFASYNLIIMGIMYFRNRSHNFEYGAQIIGMSIFFNLIPTIITMLIGKLIG